MANPNKICSTDRLEEFGGPAGHAAGADELSLGLVMEARLSKEVPSRVGKRTTALLIACGFAVLVWAGHHDILLNRRAAEKILENQNRQQEILDRLDKFRDGAYLRHQQTHEKLDALLRKGK